MKKEVIRILHEMQKWRRGNGNVMPYSPKQFGIAIDVSIRVLRRISNEDFNRLLNEEDDLRKAGQTLSEAISQEHKASKAD